MEPRTQEGESSRTAEDDESIYNILTPELVLLRLQGMRLKSVKHSRCEVFYLFYQLGILGMFLTEAGLILHRYNADLAFEPEMITKVFNFLSFVQATLSTSGEHIGDII